MQNVKNFLTPNYLCWYADGSHHSSFLMLIKWIVKIDLQLETNAFLYTTPFVSKYEWHLVYIRVLKNVKNSELKKLVEY